MNLRLSRPGEAYLPCKEQKGNSHKRMISEIPIAFVTNDGYAPYLSTAIYSLIANTNTTKR